MEMLFITLTRIFFNIPPVIHSKTALSPYIAYRESPHHLAPYYLLRNRTSPNCTYTSFRISAISDTFESIDYQYMLSNTRCKNKGDSHYHQRHPHYKRTTSTHIVRNLLRILFILWKDSGQAFIYLFIIGKGADSKADQAPKTASTITIYITNYQ